MQHSLFDRIYIAFLLILIASFGVLIVFISHYTRRSLIAEKEQTLSNDATLITSQVLASYFSGGISAENLSGYFSYYAETLSADIWYIDEKGNIVAASGRPGDLPETRAESAGDSTESDADTLSDNGSVRSAMTGSMPDNIYTLAPDYDLNRHFRHVDKFYGLYSTPVISVNVPVSFGLSSDPEDSRPAGALVMLSTTAPINALLRSIYSISFIPCLVIIAIAFIFLGIISRKVIRPVRHLSTVAQEYSEGNFDVKTGIHSRDEIGQLARSMEYMADELSKLDEYRRDFVSDISHDFRSPLTSIKGYVQAITDGTIPPEKQDRYLHIILDETNRLTKLTNSLLDLNRLESYGPYLKFSTFDFIDVIRSTLNTFEIRCLNKNLTIYLNNHAENTVVTADKMKIQQVVYNLIDNAIKFTPAGKRIDINIMEHGEKLYVSVKDEGIGMNEDTQKKVWTRFYKGDASRGKDKTGTGLGLAITREIIKAHNETIEVHSTEGRGSEFVFTLTKAKQPASKHTGNTEILISGK